MKTDIVDFNTAKSLQEISNIVRNYASRANADIVKLDDDPFGAAGGPADDIAVGLCGNNIFGFGTRGWGVRVYVIDLGSTCAVKLAALGDGLMQAMSGGEFFDLRLSKKHRDNLASMLA